ncbi:MAG TPA: hypothetical protein VF733_06100 [Candidatus Saccharimonadales bacterium]
MATTRTYTTRGGSRVTQTARPGSSARSRTTPAGSRSYFRGASAAKPVGTSTLSKTVSKGAGKTPQGAAAKTVAKRAQKRLTVPNKVSSPHPDERTRSALKFTNKTPILLAEFLIAIVVIGIGTTGNIARNGYQKSISSTMLRFSAVTGIWFVLFLLSSSKRGSNVAVLFGALVDAGIIFDAVRNSSQQGGVYDLVAMVQGQQLPGVDPTQLTAQEKPQEFYNEPKELSLTPGAV